jgi:hypothetical protein
MMDGVKQVEGTLITPSQVADPSWKVVGAGDLDGDGWADIVWQNISDGRVAAWLMSGTVCREAALLSIPQVADLRWRIRAIGDFNADGRADLVWWHEASWYLAIWLMDGLHVDIATLGDTGEPPGYEPAGSGDFDGNGNLDLVFVCVKGFWCDLGRVLIVFMNGSEGYDWSEVPFTPIPGNAWKIRAVGDLDGDGKPDLIWQHAQSGDLAVWFMDGINRISGTLLSPSNASDLGWHIVGPK